MNDSNSTMARQIAFSTPRFARRQLITRARAASLVEPEEVLISDPRGSLTPGMMVEQKLLALLESWARSLQAATCNPVTRLS